MKKLFAILCSFLFGIYNAYAATDKFFTISKYAITGCTTNTVACLQSKVDELCDPIGVNGWTTQLATQTWIVYCAPSSAGYCGCAKNPSQGWVPSSATQLKCPLSTCVCENECTSDTPWALYMSGTPFEFSTKCVDGCLTEMATYRCKSGYYGMPLTNSDKTLPTCALCPTMADSGGISRAGSSTAGNNASATNCAMSTGYTFKDTTGNYNFNTACNYSL